MCRNLQDLIKFKIIVKLEYQVFLFCATFIKSRAALFLVKTVCQNILRQLCSVWRFGCKFSGVLLFACTLSHVYVTAM